MGGENRTKFANLNKAEIQVKLDDGTLDAYDIIFCKDTREICLISADLEILDYGVPTDLLDDYYSKTEVDNLLGSLIDPDTGLEVDVETYVGIKSKNVVDEALEIEII